MTLHLFLRHQYYITAFLPVLFDYDFGSSFTRVCLTFFLLTEKEKDAPQSEWWRMVQGLLAFIKPWAFVVGAVTWNWRVIPDADPLCEVRHSCCDGSYNGHLKRRTCHVILRSWVGDQNIFSRSFLIWFIKADCSFFTSTPPTSCSNSRAHSLTAWSGSAVTRTATEGPSCQLHDMHNQNPLSQDRGEASRVHPTDSDTGSISARQLYRILAFNYFALFAPCPPYLYCTVLHMLQLNNAQNYFLGVFVCFYFYFLFILFYSKFSLCAVCCMCEARRVLQRPSVAHGQTHFLNPLMNTYRTNVTLIIIIIFSFCWSAL